MTGKFSTTSGAKSLSDVNFLLDYWTALVCETVDKKKREFLTGLDNYITVNVLSVFKCTVFVII